MRSHIYLTPRSSHSCDTLGPHIPPNRLSCLTHLELRAPQVLDDDSKETWAAGPGSDSRRVPPATAGLVQHNGSEGDADLGAAKDKEQSKGEDIANRDLTLIKTICMNRHPDDCGPPHSIDNRLRM